MFMFEKAVVGSRNYWLWIMGLLAVMAAGLYFYVLQFQEGLVVTGLTRDVSWGLYIAQLTFFVGVAASLGRLGIQLAHQLFDICQIGIAQISRGRHVSQ